MITIRDEIYLPTRYGLAKLFSFNGLEDGKEHIALTFGRPQSQSAPLVRLHSECLTGDVFGSQRCDCGTQLDMVMRQMSEEGGVLIYLRQEGRGIGLYNKISAYRLQEQGMDTFQANRALGFADDERSFTVAATILQALNIGRVRLVTNNPDKANELRAFRIEVAETVQHRAQSCVHNYRYLKSKKDNGHMILLGELTC